MKKKRISFFLYPAIMVGLAYDRDDRDLYIAFPFSVLVIHFPRRKGGFYA